MRSVIWAFVALHMTWVVPQPPIQGNHIRFEYHIPQLVELHMMGGMCSGSIVQLTPTSPAMILTARHCVPTQQAVIVKFWDGAQRVFILDHAGVGEKADYSFLVGDTRNIIPLHLNRKPTYEVNMVLLGSQNGATILAARPEEDGEIPAIGWVKGGDSGSPLIGDNNEVIGVMSAAYSQIPISVSVPARIIK